MKPLDEINFRKRYALLLFVVALMALLGSCDDSGAAAVTEKMAGESAERGCIAQYGPSERWTRHRTIYECASATRDVPANALSYPLAQQ